MSTTDDLTGRELEPAFRQGTMPAPHDLVGVLRENLHSLVLELREERGEVHSPEDVYVPVRRLGALAEGLQDYGRAFTKVAGEVRGFVQDELEEAVGEQDGVPNSGLRVPDVDGTDIKIELDTRNEYDIDIDPVIQGAVLYTLEQHPAWAAQSEEGKAGLLGLVLTLMSEGMRTLIACGRFQPQVTKVRAMATEIARTDPKVASTITDMLKRAKRTEFRGVRVTREQPK
jgi:hypothetical protein